MIPIPWLWSALGALQEEQEINAIVNFLRSKENGWTWRSTQAISSHTGIPEDGVRQLCGWHNRIRSSEVRPDMWTYEE